MPATVICPFVLNDAAVTPCVDVMPATVSWPLVLSELAVMPCPDVMPAAAVTMPFVLTVDAVSKPLLSDAAVIVCEEVIPATVRVHRCSELSL